MNQKILIIAVLPLVILAFLLGSRVGVGQPGLPTVTQAVAGSKEKFDYLVRQRSNQCGLVSRGILSYSDDEKLEGSCCGTMDLHRYQEQVEGLKKYASLSVVPQDPYDISASFAKELLGYKDSVKLTADQQKIYDGAMKLSHEGGPCCCRCWRWDAFEGQAKYLITQHDFTAEQVATVWDLEDGCGGAGHQGHG